MKLSVWPFLAAFVACSPKPESTPATESAPLVVVNQAALDSNLKTFDFVWQTIKDNHWDPSMGGLDWEESKVKYRPKVTEDIAKTRTVLRQMLGDLGHSHVGVMAGEKNSSPEDEKSSPGSSGLTLRFSQDELLVVRVEKGSSAEKSGIKPGHLVTKIGDEESATFAKEYKVSEAAYQFCRDSKLIGGNSKTLSIEVADLDGVKKEVSFDRYLPQGDIVKFGHLPAIHHNYVSKFLGGNIGYVSFTHFLGADTVPKFKSDIQRFNKTKGIVLDLRGNPGGIAAMAMGIGGYFISEQGVSLGTMSMRSTVLKFVLNPQSSSYKGHVAVLIDECSASTSEILAGGLQDVKRARLFGNTTAGAALPSVIEPLPNGDLLQYVVANYESESGRVLEGRGVIPDTPVALKRSSLWNGHDPILDAAISWIKTE